MKTQIGQGESLNEFWMFFAAVFQKNEHALGHKKNITYRFYLGRRVWYL
jgi:hypothetical protein